MKRSTDRILTTHVGSLPGRGETSTEQDVPGSVRRIVAMQREIGLDIVNEGGRTLAYHAATE